MKLETILLALESDAGNDNSDKCKVDTLTDFDS